MREVEIGAAGEKRKEKGKGQKEISIFLSFLAINCSHFILFLTLTNKHKLSSQTEGDQIPFCSTDRII